METLGQRIVRLRGAISQHRLAKMAGISQGRLRDIETGATPDPRGATVAKIAAALGITSDELQTGQVPGALAEGDAAPYDTGDAKGLLYLLAPTARHPTAYRIARALPGFALAEGDTLVVELQGKPLPGQLVVTNLANPVTGTAETVVRRYLPPLLLAQDGQTVLQANDERVGGLWPVLASWRGGADLGS